MSVSAHPFRRYMRNHVTRTTTCPGCGNGIITQAILRAIDELGLDMDDFIFVSGIGCSAWIPSPLFAADTLHTTHGRPIAFATGIKLCLPEKNILVASGDGDLAAIGGNHLIHAARRNIDMTVVLVNNGIYGMEHTFDICAMVAAAGASYVTRWTTYHPRQMTRSIKKAIVKKGFALVEAISQCPVQFGRAAKLGKAVDMLKHFKENSIRIDKARNLDEEALKGKIVVGEFVDIEKAELASEWARLKQEVMEV